MIKKLSELIGGGYDDFWTFRGRYRVVKGSRGSKKSTTTALWIIYMMMYYYHTHRLKPSTLVIRRYQYTHTQSTRAQLIWAINKLGVSDLWRVQKTDLTIKYIPSGQLIIFRGFDDPQSITSITTDKGNLCWVWIEEASQIESENDFNKLDLSIRGEIHPKLFKQITITMNPWNINHFIKKRFFDVKDDNILAITTTYKCNEWLGADDIALFDDMKKRNPRRYQVEGKGEWGVSEGVIYSNWYIKNIDMKKVMNRQGCRNVNYIIRVGIDFGYTDPTAIIADLIDITRKEIYVYWEWYFSNATNEQIADAIKTAGLQKCTIIADSEDPRTIRELKNMGIIGIKGAKKEKGSVNAGIQILQDYTIFVDKKCVNMQDSLTSYHWDKDKKTDTIIPTPSHEYSHAADALRYSIDDIRQSKIEV